MPMIVGEHLVDAASPLYPQPVYEDRVYIVAQQTKRVRVLCAQSAGPIVVGSAASARSTDAIVASAGNQ